MKLKTKDYIIKIANLIADRVILIIDQRSKTLFDKQIWTIDDFVTVTGIAKQTVYNKTSKDEIPHRKRAGKLFFLPEEIHDWIDEGDE